MKKSLPFSELRFKKIVLAKIFRRGSKLESENYSQSVNFFSPEICLVRVNMIPFQKYLPINVPVTITFDNISFFLKLF